MKRRSDQQVASKWCEISQIPKASVNCVNRKCDHQLTEKMASGGKK